MTNKNLNDASKGPVFPVTRTKEWPASYRLERDVLYYILDAEYDQYIAATAQRFVQESAFVFITGRRQDELDKAVKQIGRNVIKLNTLSGMGVTTKQEE